MNRAIDIYSIDGHRPDAELADNPACGVIILAWMMAAEGIVDEIQWFRDVCKHFELDGDDVPDIIAAGFAACDNALAERDKAQNSGYGRSHLLQAEKALLHLLSNPDCDEAPALRNIPALLRSGAALSSGSGNDMLQCVFENIVLPLMHPAWLKQLAGAEQQMFYSETEDDAQTVSSLLEELTNYMLPDSLQSPLAVQAVLVASAHALAHHFPESISIWEAVTQSFIDTLE